jgi:hypothetical protein
VRYRLMATYQGAPFEAGIGPTGADVVLFAACPPPEELGFEPATGHWRKQLSVADVDAVWESRPIGMFRGARCMVLDDLGDRLHIGYLGHDGYQAEELGYWQVDRGVYEVVADRAEVTDLVEQQAEYPRTPAVEPAAQPRPAPEAGAGLGYPAGESPGYPPAESSIYVSSAPAGSSPGYLPSGPIGYRPAAEAAGVRLPAAADTPLPLEAAALAAAQASQSRQRAAAPPPTAGADSETAAIPPSDIGVQPAAGAVDATAAAGPDLPSRKRLATEQLFAELASMAGIPVDAYAIGEEVDGALCLLETEHGFEVFQSANGNRLELKFFSSEESACFYLFGVLAAEAIRSGALVPHKVRRLPLRRTLPVPG